MHLHNLQPLFLLALKSLFVTARDTAKNGTLTYFPYSCNNFLITSYIFRICAQVLPSKLPDNIPKMLSETLKAIGSVGILNHQPSIEYSSYTQDIAVANAGDASVALDTAYMVYLR